jgi:hypothetical protein
MQIMVVVLCSVLMLVASDAHAASVTISKQEYGNDWPFSCEKGILSCEQNGLVTFTTGGKTYAINGAARTAAERRGWNEVHPIWRNNPEFPGTKINIGPIIRRGLDLCK